MTGDNRSGSTPHWLLALRAWISGPQILAFLPALCLAAYWLVGEGGLLVVALLLPVIWGGLGLFGAASQMPDTMPLSPLDKLATHIGDLLQRPREQGRTAVFAIALDDADDFQTRFDHATLRDVNDQIRLRLGSVLRSGDLVVQSDLNQWLVALAPGPRLDLEAAIQQAARLQNEIEEPLFAAANRLYFTASVGFTLGGPGTEASAQDIIARATAALTLATAQGPASVRLYTPSMAAPYTAGPVENPDFGSAELGDVITAWFQPQVSTDTGQVSGFEALARWQHPDQGILAPAAFLPHLESTGQLEQLGEVMLRQALTALGRWDAEGFDISTVGVNYSEQDLSNPKLYDKIAWDLDRFDIAPHRLCIEILEDVVARADDDVIARNVMRLSGLGCQIDLDDFGTGHASISSLRRFPIERLKIDRSFIAKTDLDPEQQKMVGTILLMADRLGLSCLAEGVETLGEHAMVAQLGCRYVQGYGIAKPMPLEATVPWIANYQTRLSAVPQIGGKAG